MIQRLPSLLGSRGKWAGTPFSLVQFLFVLCLIPTMLHAARIGDSAHLTFSDQALRFLSLKDPSVRYAILGSILLGICSGMMGSFIVVRKMALMGDALSHAVLPGVAMGFLWSATKDPLAIFIGATIAGLLGSATVHLITQTTRLKEDTAIGMVLATYFSVGICMVTRIQKMPTGNKSGIDKFLFGQIAGLGREDVLLMTVVTLAVLILVLLFYKEFLATCFDSQYARSLGIPSSLFLYGIMLLLAFSVVIALQAVGVVLVSAMLITPAASAYLLTDRFRNMILLSAIFGMMSGILGAFASFLGHHLPTGPFMVLGASTVFFTAILLSPKHGILLKWWRNLSRTRRIHRENILKAIYHVLESRDFKGSEIVLIVELAERRRETVEEIRRIVRQLKHHHMATFSTDQQSILLTPEGWQRACEIVRNHRLWELYLTHAAQIAADHVHEDAEKIEHVLGDAIVMQLEKRLQYARTDPHGRRIPSLEDIRISSHKPIPGSQTTGYR